MPAIYSQVQNRAVETLKLSDVQVRTPCQPSKMICLWNNFHQLAAKNDFQQPKEPLWFLKAPNSYWPANRPIERPATYAGKIIYEGELGVVIGKKCFNISEAEAGDYIFGYTCVNDVTAVDLLRKDKSFEQWARAKSFDTFGVFGPVIATGVDPMKLSVKTILNGKERQNYPVADMFFPPHKLVAAISKDVTLMPGDIIACGTSLGAGTMGDAHNVVDIVIDGVGSSRQCFRPGAAEPIPARRAAQAEEDLRGRRGRHRRPAGGQVCARGRGRHRHRPGRASRRDPEEWPQAGVA